MIEASSSVELYSECSMVDATTQRIDRAEARLYDAVEDEDNKETLCH